MVGWTPSELNIVAVMKPVCISTSAKPLADADQLGTALQRETPAVARHVEVHQDRERADVRDPHGDRRVGSERREKGGGERPGAWQPMTAKLRPPLRGPHRRAVGHGHGHGGRDTVLGTEVPARGLADGHAGWSAPPGKPGLGEPTRVRLSHPDQLLQIVPVKQDEAQYLVVARPRVLERPADNVEARSRSKRMTAFCLVGLEGFAGSFRDLIARLRAEIAIVDRLAGRPRRSRATGGTWPGSSPTAATARATISSACSCTPASTGTVRPGVADP